MDSILDNFFNREFDAVINEKIPEYSFERYETDVMEYVYHILSIELDDYFKWIDTHFSLVELSAEDAVQYSKLVDATSKVVTKIIENGDRGFTHIEIGKMLLDDGKKRKDGAYVKYGENHIKVAKYIGYTFSMDRFYYVSAFGYASTILSEQEQNKLYSRLFMRTPLFRMVYLMSKADVVKMRELFDFLSDSTYLRRRGNIRRLFMVFNNNNDYGDFLLEKMDFEL